VAALASAYYGIIGSLVFPGVPIGILVLCLMTAVITLALGAPLTDILLVIVIGTTNQEMMALIVLSSVIALIIGMTVRQIREKRAAGNSAVQH
jgi:H+/Cl- antiporter ClcA